MITLTWILAGITALFFAALALKRTLPNICAICVAVSISWIALILLWWADLFTDTLIIGILIGESIVGLYYLLRSRLVERLQLFSLPFILTLTLAAYTVLTGTLEIAAVILVGAVWIVFGLVFALRASPTFKKLFNALIACCKNW